MTGSLGSGTDERTTSVSGSGVVAVRFAVVEVWLIHSSLRDRLIVYATSSEVSGRPSDHFWFGRILYVHVLPSGDPFHDAASPGIGEKSFDDLPVSSAYCRFHAS